MNVCVISASMRKKSQSRKVSDYLCRRLNAFNNNAWVLDLYETKLPMFDDGETQAENINEVLRQIDDAEAYVFVSPEWNGMMSHGLINMFHYVKHQMSNKPAMLVGVSSGRGGAYPIADMKLLGQKNKHFVISPENLIVSNVKEIFNDDSQDENIPDILVKKRADYSLRVLVEYAKALKQVRDSGIIDLEAYPNGV